jgi:DUF1680 family protein
VNLYIPSNARTVIKETEVKANLTTDYPKNGRIALTLGLARDLRFTLRFRVPQWITSPVSARVNGKGVRVRSKPGTWAEIHRTWSNGDRAVIEIPLRLRLEPLGENESDPGAVMYGPVVLATGDDDSSAPALAKDPSSWLSRTDDSSLVFETGGNAVRKIFKPFFDFKEGERYRIYQLVRKG